MAIRLRFPSLVQFESAPPYEPFLPLDSQEEKCNLPLDLLEEHANGRKTQ